MNHILKFSIILIVITACHREKTDFIGPAYISAPAGFAVTNFTSSSTSINLFSPASKVSFNATFSSTVSWILTITGQQSGAVSTITGTSNGLSNLEWKGVQNNIYFFRKGENVTVTLSFYGNIYTASSSSIHLLGVPNFPSIGLFSQYGDFEIPSQVLPYYATPNNHYSSFWASFNFPDSIPHMAQGIDSAAVDYNGNKVHSVQGLYYYYIKGLGNQSSYVSGLQYYGALIPSSSTLPADPSQVWVNMYIYGTGDANNSVDLEYQEADAGHTTYTANQDDAWVAHLTLDHKGWKLFSIKYSDLVITSNTLFGGSGNHVMEPNRIASWDIVLIKKSNPNSPVEVYFDYPIITKGGPFIPYK